MFPPQSCYACSFLCCQYSFKVVSGLLSAVSSTDPKLERSDGHVAAMATWQQWLASWRSADLLSTHFAFTSPFYALRQLESPNHPILAALLSARQSTLTMAAFLGTSMNLAMRPQNTLRSCGLKTSAPRTGRMSVHVQAVSSVFKRNKAPTKPVSTQTMACHSNLLSSEGACLPADSSQRHRMPLNA